MSWVEQASLPLLRLFDPERAHGLALRALNSGLAPSPGQVTSPRLRTQLAGLDLPNPIGLAAGFDKNAEALGPLSRAGFGFLEVGAITPRPQPGSPKPRLFRLTEDDAVINRFGFNNDGMEVAVRRLSRRPKNAVIGLNLGANKDSTDRAEDFAKVLSHCGTQLDFATVNVSSPNTEKLRDLQGAEALSKLLAGVMTARAELQTPIPIFLKIAPDLTDSEINEIADVAVTAGLHAVIATNTTLSRDGLKDRQRDEKGGLSGRPLFRKSTRVLARMAVETRGQIPLIGVGGVSSAEDAMTKIRAGASAVQLYSAMVYQGISLIPRMARELDHLLEVAGHASVSEIVGVDSEEWAA